MMVFKDFLETLWELLDIFSPLVPWLTLLVVIAYTAFTYRLMRAQFESLRQQHEFFKRINRPWVFVGDFVYQHSPKQLAVTLYNSGKQPAKCRIIADWIRFTPKGSETITEARSTHVTENYLIMPHIRDIGPVHLQRFALPEPNTVALVDQCKVEAHIRIEYGSLVERTDWWEPYRYEATHLSFVQEPCWIFPNWIGDTWGKGHTLFQ